MPEKKDDDYKKDIKIIAENIKRSSSNFVLVRQNTSTILNMCGKLQDTNLAAQIRNHAVAILATTNSAEIEKAADAIIELVSPAQKLLPPGSEKKDQCIDPIKVIKTKRYLADCKRYKSQANISEIEYRIENLPCQSNLHEPIKYGSWAGRWHARLTDNLRIMYLWDNKNKILTYETIITKNEFDKS